MLVKTVMFGYDRHTIVFKIEGKTGWKIILFCLTIVCISFDFSTLVCMLSCYRYFLYYFSLQGLHTISGSLTRAWYEVLLII